MSKKVKDDDFLMTIDEFLRDVKDGGLIDYDGYGRYVTEDNIVTSITVKPSDLKIGLLDYPYIVWYNK